MDRIEETIIEEFKKYASNKANQQKSDGEWTHDLKVILQKLGDKLLYITCASGFKKSVESEWLFDLTWYKQVDKRLEIGLVMESEWLPSIDEIKHDFQKLLIARADHRLMIFTSPNKESFIKRIGEFEVAIQEFEYSLKGDRWLFIAFDNKGNLIEKKSYIHQ